ncbi:hypothetical protein BCV72DRAFT_261782 [Rhizopus microsporus var. microsporus]|uniref:Uncharacterized protein n=2 Tax=Rhizopus microsporus TaxID=58291 RepID=A0A2G4SXS5_RHIZD|nr:uncharacterized protein RHIMIDRAFT_250757 [Rhizopus microsporus ATCC 52813]ORE07915.1 hypothetical protein BCV72DRAFT_261782 [Rhizopus microsporus var. microsporus]PHZ13598.1 hypothetical protein RHIMIDRAFT_250757 [Rhizopus microsporus ATCC 52813]
MKIDLRLVAARSNKRLSDNGYDKFAKFISEPKFYKDKRKAVFASKALLNSIIRKNPFINCQEIHVPYVIVMVFELHLCSLSLSRKKTYITRNLKSVSFPSTLDNLPEALANGLLGLLPRGWLPRVLEGKAWMISCLFFKYEQQQWLANQDIMGGCGRGGEGMGDMKDELSEDDDVEEENDDDDQE